MSRYEQHEIVPVPRHRVFVLQNGTFVVQWEEQRVQALLTGRYQAYTPGDPIEPISDWELNQLRNVGIVHEYDDELVHLIPTPTIVHQAPTRSYYLNTGLPRANYDAIVEALNAMKIAKPYVARIQNPYVIIRQHDGAAFNTFDAAEQAREVLMEHNPDMFQKTVVAFLEIISATEDWS